jgi:hypothetical protein
MRYVNDNHFNLHNFVSVGTNDPHPGIIYCGADPGGKVFQVWDHDMLTPTMGFCWNDSMSIPTTGFCLMCGMTQLSTLPQALPDVWDDVM